MLADWSYVLDVLVIEGMRAPWGHHEGPSASQFGHNSWWLSAAKAHGLHGILILVDVFEDRILGTSWHILAHLGTESEGDIRGPPAGCHPFQGDPVECSTLKQMGMSQRTQKSMNIYEHRTQRCNASNVLRISSNQIHHTMQSIQDFLVFLSSFNIFYFNIFQLTGWIPSFSQLGSIGNQFHQDGLLPVRSCFPGIRKRHVHFFWSCQRILSNQAQRGNINSMELGLCVTPVAIATAKPQFCQGFVHAGQGSIYDGN